MRREETKARRVVMKITMKGNEEDQKGDLDTIENYKGCWYVRRECRKSRQVEG
jgi:hypothetical protein